MISSNFALVRDHCRRGDFETVGDFFKYYKSTYGSVTSDDVLALFMVLRDGYLKGDL